MNCFFIKKSVNFFFIKMYKFFYWKRIEYFSRKINFNLHNQKNYKVWRQVKRVKKRLSRSSRRKLNSLSAFARRQYKSFIKKIPVPELKLNKLQKDQDQQRFSKIELDFIKQRNLLGFVFKRKKLNHWYSNSFRTQHIRGYIKSFRLAFPRREIATWSKFFRRTFNIYLKFLQKLKKKFLFFFLDFKKFFFSSFVYSLQKNLLFLSEYKNVKFVFFFDFLIIFLKVFLRLRWLFFFRYFCFFKLFLKKFLFFLGIFNLKNLNLMYV
jgi:hypothetical protein